MATLPRDIDERMNNEITAKEVRVVDEHKTQIGVMPLAEALKLAREKGVDLIEISPDATPPVCKIIDYGKYRFEIQKRLKEAKKRQKVVHLKEIKMRPKIDVHDYTFKMNHVKDFLAAGDKVKVTIMFRGREMNHTEIGFEIMKRVLEDLKDIAFVEKEAKLEGRNLTAVVSQKKH
ncbi:MAG: translation initiation factor IF-3 [Spirochaetes bacterium]|nr:translation initiation factor IF-3 [Spirochaetota bacterium]